MSRKFIGYVAAAALLVTAIGSQPAKADEDLATALAALVGVAIVGSLIADSLDDDDPKVTKRRSVPVAGLRDQPRARADRIYREVHPRPLPRRADRTLLPGDCLRSFRTRDGRLRVFETHCLRRQYGFTNSLPRSCSVSIRARHEQRRGYDARCLHRAGYKLARG